MKSTYVHVLSITLVWLTFPSLQATPVTGTPPFVLNGSNVTTPNASGNYTHSNFTEPFSAYTVVVEPISGQSMTLKNPDSVIDVGSGSTITINGLTTLQSTKNHPPVIKIKGDGSVDIGNGVTITGANGINITGNGTVNNLGTILASDTYGIQVNSGKVTNAGYIASDNGPDILATKATTIVNTGTLGGYVGVAGKKDLVFTNSGSIITCSTGVVAKKNAMITNTGVIDSGDQGIWIQKSGTVINSGTINGATEGILMKKGTVTNTGTISGGDGGVIMIKGTLINSGTIDGGLYAALITKKGTVQNSGVIDGQIYGLFLGKGGTLSNSGMISGSTVGVLFASSNGTITNSGLIQSSCGEGIVINKGTVTNSSKGSILGGVDGINFISSGTVINSGLIGGTTGNGILFNKQGTVLLQNGGVSGVTGTPLAPSDAILTNLYGGKQSTVTVQGRSLIVGGITSAGTTGILNLSLVGMSPAQAAAINAMAGATSGDIFIGTHEYKWTNFKLNAHAISLQQVVDPGLQDLATRIDNANQSLSFAYDPLYLAALVDPEGTLNNFSGREFLNAFSQVGLSTATTLSALADERAFSIRSGATGIDLSGLNVNSSSMIASLGDVQNVLTNLSIASLAANRMSDSREAMFTRSSSDLPWGVWASGAVTIGNNSGSFSDPSYHTTIGSPTIGFDYHLFPEFVVGGLVNYTTSGAYFGDGSQLNGDTVLFGGYADWSHDHWFINSLVAGGFSSYDQTRKTLGTTATASPDGSEVMANVSGGYDIKIGSWLVSPEAGVNYTYLEKDGFSETGAGAFNLNVGQQDVNSFRTKLGFHVSNLFKWDGMKFSPELHASWYHECLDNTNGVSTSVPGAPALGTFLVTTTPAGRDFALLGCGISVMPSEMNDHLTLFLNYDAQVGQANYISHTVDGGFRIGF